LEAVVTSADPVTDRNELAELLDLIHRGMFTPNVGPGERARIFDSVRAALVQRDARDAAVTSRVLDEVERIVRSEAGPGDVYMRADVLSVLAQVRARAAGST
jgi:hypothetical protein